MTSFITVNPAHLHLILNHVPTIGTVVALALLLLAVIRRHEGLTHVGLEVLFMIAVLTLPVYTSGVAAYEKLRKEQPQVSEFGMKVHQDSALAGFVATEFAGFVAWLALWQSRRRGRTSRALVRTVILLSIVALVLMGRAANLGGEIRHPEILSEIAAAAPADESKQFIASAIGTVAVYSTWVWPAAEAVHFLGLSLSLGVLLAINLRILGVMKRVAFADVHRLLPWGMLGFGANFITGMFFFVGQPAQYTTNGPFQWKLLFLVIAGANFLYLTVFNKAWNGDVLKPNLADKAMAAGSIFSWLAVLYAGRMLPFLGNSF